MQAVAPAAQDAVPGADWYGNPDRELIPEWDNPFDPASHDERSGWHDVAMTKQTCKEIAAQLP